MFEKPASGTADEQPLLVTSYGKSPLDWSRDGRFERKWEFRYLSPSTAGLLTTASGLIFSGDAEGNLLALDSRDGKLLWRYQMGAAMHGTSPTTYMLDGRQHVLVPAGTTLTAWALPQ